MDARVNFSQPVPDVEPHERRPLVRQATGAPGEPGSNRHSMKYAVGGLEESSYEVDHTDAQRMRQGSAQLDPFARTATNRVDDDPFSRHYESQFVNCDIRTFPMQTLGKFPVRTRRSPRTRDLSARGTRATRPRRLR